MLSAAQILYIKIIARLMNQGLERMWMGTDVFETEVLSRYLHSRTEETNKNVSQNSQTEMWALILENMKKQ